MIKDHAVVNTVDPRGPSQKDVMCCLDLKLPYIPIPEEPHLKVKVFLYQSQSIASGRGDCFLKCTIPMQGYRARAEQEKHVPQKEHSKRLVTETKQTARHELPDKEF